MKKKTVKKKEVRDHRYLSSGEWMALGMFLYLLLGVYLFK